MLRSGIHSSLPYRWSCTRMLNQRTLQIEAKRQVMPSPGLQICSQKYIDRFVVAASLKTCGNTKALSDGKRIHHYITHNMLQKDIYIVNLLMEMYCKCGDLQNARHVFDHIHRRNMFSWNIIVAGYAGQGMMEEALQLFQHMPERDVITWTTMVAGYAKAGLLQEAFQVFYNMPERNIISWNTMLSGYIKNSKLNEAVILFSIMPHDEVSWSILISGYAHHGHLQEAYQMFRSMPQRNVVTWNVMIAAYGQHDEMLDQAVTFFYQMQLQGVIPDKITFISVLDICARKADLALGRKMHNYILQYGIGAVVAVMNALINVYSKCGAIEEACEIFTKMHEHNVISWTAMIAAYAQCGHFKEAHEMFQQMMLKGVMPNSITLVCILSACVYAGLESDCYHFFVSMSTDNAIAPVLEHFTCMIDLLGCSGLDLVKSLINNMPFEADGTAWRSLLNSYKIYGDPLSGKIAALSELD